MVATIDATDAFCQPASKGLLAGSMNMNKSETGTRHVHSAQLPTEKHGTLDERREWNQVQDLILFSAEYLPSHHEAYPTTVFLPAATVQMDRRCGRRERLIKIRPTCWKNRRRLIATLVAGFDFQTGLRVRKVDCWSAVGVPKRRVTI